MKAKLPVIEARLYDAACFDENRTVIQFRDNELLLTDTGGRGQDPRQTKIIQDARQTRYGGRMTKQAQKRMTKAITLLSQISKAKWIVNPVSGRYQYFKLSLITLTVSSVSLVPHKEAYKKLLSPFLEWLRYTVGCRHYVWKAELQERGQIHYHLMIPKFIDYRVLREKWNRLQSDSGYLREYVSKTKKVNPNSTDVKAIGNEKNVSKYLIKYLSKGEAKELLKAKFKAENDYQFKRISKEELQKVVDLFNAGTPKIDGKLWDCSENLNEKYFTVKMTWKLSMVLQQFINDNPGIAYYGERFCFLQIDFTDPPDFMLFVMKRYKCYLDVISKGGKKFLQSLN
jgi:hypothetical protein